MSTENTGTSHLDEIGRKGAFIESLRRTNTKIRADRAQSISEDADLVYKRLVEDMEMKIRKMEREQENMLDLSPSHSEKSDLSPDCRGLFGSGRHESAQLSPRFQTNRQFRQSLLRELFLPCPDTCRCIRGFPQQLRL